MVGKSEIGIFCVIFGSFHKKWSFCGSLCCFPKFHENSQNVLAKIWYTSKFAVFVCFSDLLVWYLFLWQIRCYLHLPQSNSVLSAVCKTRHSKFCSFTLISAKSVFHLWLVSVLSFSMMIFFDCCLIHRLHVELAEKSKLCFSVHLICNMENSSPW